MFLIKQKACERKKEPMEHLDFCDMYEQAPISVTLKQYFFIRQNKVIYKINFLFMVI